MLLKIARRGKEFRHMTHEETAFCRLFTTRAVRAAMRMCGGFAWGLQAAGFRRVQTLESSKKQL